MLIPLRAKHGEGILAYRGALGDTRFHRSRRSASTIERITRLDGM